MKQVKSPMWNIALPILLNMLVSQLQTVIDRAFLGQLDPGYIAALGNVSAPLWASLAVIWALTTGATILMSRAVGAGDPGSAAETAHASLKYNGLISIALFLFWVVSAESLFRFMGVKEPILGYCTTYLRLISPLILFTGIGASCTSILQVSGYTAPVMVAGVVRSGLNIVLDWLLIFGNLGFPALGLEGGAMATGIAETAGGLLLVVLLARTRRLAFPLSAARLFRAKLRSFIAVAKLGIPSSLEEFLWNLGQLGLIRMLNALDRLAAGVYTIVFSVDIVPAFVFIALGQAVLALTGKKTGEGDRAGAMRFGTDALKQSLFISLAFALVFFLAPSFILRIFTSDRDVIASSTVFLYIAALNLFPRSANITLGSGIRGYGDTRWMLTTQLLGTCFVLAASAVFLFVFRTGIIGIFLTIILDETFRALLNYHRYRKGPAEVGAVGSGGPGAVKD